MSVSLILIVTICYVGVGCVEAFKNNWGVAIMFLGYALANVGTIIIVTK